jgi:hypothetical protein
LEAVFCVQSAPRLYTRNWNGTTVNGQWLAVEIVSQSAGSHY